MKQVTRKVFGRVTWMARGTATVLGLAVMLAVVLGVGTAALAAVPGDPFRLGQANAINALTTLTGTRDGAMLDISNFAVTPNATALSLHAEQGTSPIKVNPQAGKATGLDADELDGKDSGSFASGTFGKANDADRLDGKDSTAFWSGKVYKVIGPPSRGDGNGDLVKATASCASPSDRVLTVGGGTQNGFQDDLLYVEPAANGASGSVFVRDNAGPDTASAEVLCADLTP